ncbi:MAG: cation diffusion facilitator family transporter [Oscillospiraceae bacterium]|nr:cation diffusion facilitator family transporter [Oscillospiraceae bacterium]
MKNETAAGTQLAGNFEKTATRVSVVSVIGNALLSVFKLLAGLLAHSGAMVSDAVHSASDVLSSFIVIIGVKLSQREADRDHPYGHERFECVAAIVLAVVLAGTGLLIGLSAVESIGAGASLQAAPGLLALIAAIVSIVSKEGMYWYTRHYAKRLNSPALMANAWHHRSDALSSVGALIGIAGARLGVPVMEPVASLVICVFILKAAYDIFRDATGKMVDRACDAETERRLSECVLSDGDVLGIDRLQTREFGSRIYVDLEIRADGRLSLYEAHGIAERVHDEIERQFPSVKHIMVHVNPDRPPEE